MLGFAMLKNTQAQNFNPNLANLLQTKLDSLVTAFQGNTKGVSIGIYCPGQGYWTGVSGISHQGVNITPDMKYGIASNSKMYIAVTLLRMAEDQLLNLDSPISTWLDPIPNVDATATVRQLLNHTSGIDDPFFSTSLLDSINAHPTHVYTPQEIFTYVGAPLFPVGTSYSYSNINYILSGMIAEEISGLSMAQLVRNYILTPLSLTSTFYDYIEPEITPLAHRWHSQLDYSDTSRISLNSAGGPAGAIFSNADDMVHWYHSIMDGQLLNENSFAQLSDFISFGALGNYGLGIQRTTFFNRETWGHGGSTHGYKSRTVYDPCSKFVVCGLSNDDWSAIDGITLLMYKALVDNLPDCSATITGESIICQGQQNLTYTVPEITNATSYSWTFPNGFVGLSATNSITVDASMASLSGDISVKGINMYGEGATSKLSITVNPVPATANIILNGDQIHSDAPNGNQWYDQNGILVGEINQDFNYTLAGSYYVIVNLLGCNSSQSNTINTFNLGIVEGKVAANFKLYPNPTSDNVTLALNGNEKTSNYRVYNILNQEVMKGDFSQTTILEFKNLNVGVYTVKVENGNNSFVQRLVKR